MDHHLRQHRTFLHHGAVGSQVAVQHRQAAGLGVGVISVPDHIFVLDLRLGDPVRPGAIHCAGRSIDEPHLIQPLHDGAQAAGII